MMNGKQVYIVHGYTASVKDHWFQWIKTALEKEGISVHLLAMPDSGKPQPAAWINHLKENVKINDQTYFVGHSLGCITLLLYLNRYQLKARGMILVAGFLEQLKNIPELDSFLEEQISTEMLIQNVPERLVIAATDDDIVPFELSRKQALALDASLIVIPDGGHFLGRNGFKEFPELLKELKTMIS